jgi:DNA excision repair protein ERCC-4
VDRPWIVADRYEVASGVPAALRALRLDVDVTALNVGDYDVGAGVVVERKSVADLHGSLGSGRLWTQLYRLRGAAHHPYLLVEGVLDAGAIGAHGVRGALLAVMDSGVAVIQTRSIEDSALWLARLAARAQRQRPARGVTFPLPRVPIAPDEAAEMALAAIPGISSRLSRRLLRHFGSVAAIANASAQDLAAVDGIGRVRAADIAATLQGRQPASQ